MSIMRGCSVHGKNVGLHGDKTTSGAQCIAARPGMSVMGLLKLYIGDKTTPCPKCGKVGIIVDGDHRCSNSVAVAVDGAEIRCGCPQGTNFLIAPGTIPQLSAASARMAPIAAPEPEQHAQAAKKPRPESLPLPARIYQTVRQMDDYRAKDMRYGDLDTLALRNQFYIDVDNVSAKVNPRTLKLQPTASTATQYSPYAMQSLEQQTPSVSKGEATRLMFDEFRELAKLYSFHGPYKSIITEMITHMQENYGTPYSSPLLDQALKEQILNDHSDKSSLLKIKKAMKSAIDYEYGFIPLSNENVFYREISEAILPKFDRKIDNTNGLVITVHDTWSTHITLVSLQVSGNSYRAMVHYRVQDHFGLDDDDVLNPVYREFRIFRLWFALQRWDQYGYKPFITEMNATVEITGDVE
ncbi:PAAR domain-containing protein [Enterobacter sp. EGD-HP1]|uniref:PAAR domain-containing protein n=1 Tax=Enterobacter sp. EGD-HP1 TaxID=1357268 RepID=UPI001E441AED|nr:PAAR domain-containing protein [Enterobacter sp. EGD-HP1]